MTLLLVAILGALLYEPRARRIALLVLRRIGRKAYRVLGVLAHATGNAVRAFCATIVANL
jgi:hypothetical protein